MVKDIYHTHNNQKRAHVAILLTDTISTKKKVVTRDKKKHFIIKKGSIHQKLYSIINTYTPNNKDNIYEAKFTELKYKTNKNSWGLTYLTFNNV